MKTNLSCPLSFILALTGAVALGAEIKVVTEFIYPTEFTVTPITATSAGGAGTAQIVGGVVEPGGFETREVGVAMSVIASAKGLGEWGDSAALREEKGGGNTELMAAASLGSEATVRRLLARGDEVNSRNAHGSTALMGAAAGGFESIVKLLVASGAEVDAASKKGSTALMFAARNGHEAVCRLLLENGAGIDAADKQGLTALLHAVHGGHTKVAQSLVERGADINRRDGNGTTPLMLANHEQKADIVVLLTKSGAR